MVNSGGSPGANGTSEIREWRSWRKALAGVTHNLAALAVAAMWLPTAVIAATGAETKVVSHVYNGYARVKLADGSYNPVTYVFAEGGIFDGEPIGADSINEMGFDEVARIVAGSLKGQNFLSSQNVKATEQLIVLWYGTTRRTFDKPTAYRIIDSMNYRILGFQKEVNMANGLSFADFAQVLLNEARAGRYFVVLKAYDFEVAKKEKRLKLLWESRFSIQRQGVSFSSELPAMAQFAARTFGRETDGILNPDSIKGEVKFGELKVLGVETPDQSGQTPGVGDDVQK